MATGRAHAETLRLSLLYALLNGSDVIRVEHLRAALSLWRYCEASARRIFGLDAASGSGDRCVGGRGSTDTPPLPLHLRLLDIIVKTPGISRKGLHEATGNRIKADDMEAALASLEAQGLADRGRCQPEGGGRPAECWWPAGDDFDGDEGVTFTMNADDSSPSDASPHCLASAALSADRTNKQAPIAMIGQMVSSFAGADANVTDGAKAPSQQTQTPKPYPSPTPTSDAEPLPRCSCGALVERPGDEICSSCFKQS